ncbi:MAG: polysaccharide biosynthesis tyrosine autokinase, partial [Candidatus Auribacterota bacterium]|nr:polysaccharide biosynthesis tyrosine autokinase [Candidatus Auribacterota bacterium]
SIIMQLKNRLVQIQATLAEYSQRYKSKHPKMLQLRAEQKTVEDSLQTEIAKIIQSLKTEYELAQANEARLLADLEKQKSLAFNMERKIAAIDDLKAKVIIKREGQQALLSRVNETSMTKGIEITNIRVIDEAEVPRTPFKPRKLFNIILSLVIGTAGGIGAIFLIENLDNSVKTSTDAKKILHLPFLGLIPLYSQIHIKAGTSPLEIIKSKSGLIPEAFRTIRTGIYFSSADYSPRIILVTSSLPQEGKTDISTQLSVIMAQIDEKVLLIDGDMRKPRLEKIFGVNNNSKGFSSLLREEAKIDEVVQPSGIPGLDIIPCGIIPPNPSELINSHRFKEIMTIAGKRWDRIILDSPPILSVTDATIMSRSVDGVIMVVRAGSTSGKIAVFCREKLEHVQARFIGVILNRADINRGDDYYYYYANYYTADT